MRKFNVLFINKKGRVTAYQNLEGQKAIKVMESLIERGFTCVAETTANNITEQLTIEEMKEAVL